VADFSAGRGVLQGDEVIDVDLRGAAAVEADPPASIRVREGARLDDAGASARPDLRVAQVASQDVVAGVAAVAIRVGPRRSELLAPVAVAGALLAHGQRVTCSAHLSAHVAPDVRAVVRVHGARPRGPRDAATAKGSMSR
jgi:hypothetical protein